jgi:hypothetical protein
MQSTPVLTKICVDWYHMLVQNSNIGLFESQVIRSDP